jgi:hypothetical protein
MVSENAANDRSGMGGPSIVAVFPLAHQADERLPQRPPPPACPGRGIEIHDAAERLTTVGIEVGPGDDSVTRRVAHTAGAEVDDGAQQTIAGQQIIGADVSVKPPWPLRPGGGSGRGPGGFRARPTISAPSDSIAARVSSP